MPFSRRMLNHPHGARRRSPAPLAWAGLAVLAAAFGAVLYIESFVAAPPCCLAAWPRPNPIQVERQVERLDPHGVSADLQAAAARQVIAARPVDTSGWLRLAYADTLAHGRLTEAGRRALAVSYTMSAYAGRNAGWRLAFALDHWGALDADTRRQVLTELAAADKLDYPHREAVRARIGAITDPLGRYEAYKRDMLALPATKPATKPGA